MKKLYKTFSYNSGCLAAIIQFCLTYPIFCDCDIKEKLMFIIVVYIKIALQRENRVNVSAFLRAGKVREVANLVGVSRTTVYAIKERMDDGEGVSRRTGSGRKAVVDRDCLHVC